MKKSQQMKSGAKRQAHRPRRQGLTTKGKGSRVNDVASLSETFQFIDGKMDVVYYDYTCSLQQHLRASTVAAGYQEYRIKLVEYKFKPLSDTYAPQAGGGGIVIPYLYYLTDKVRANNNLLTLDGFKKAGAKPIRFDDKTITVKYKPAVLIDGYDMASPTGGVPRQYRISPWLTTNDNNTNPGVFIPSAVDHNGIRWFVDGTSADLTYSIERTIHLEFRKPMWNELGGVSVPSTSVELLIPSKVVTEPVVEQSTV